MDATAWLQFREDAVWVIITGRNKKWTERAPTGNWFYFRKHSAHVGTRIYVQMTSKLATRAEILTKIEIVTQNRQTTSTKPNLNWNLILTIVKWLLNMWKASSNSWASTSQLLPSSHVLSNCGMQPHEAQWKGRCDPSLFLMDELCSLKWSLMQCPVWPMYTYSATAQRYLVDCAHGTMQKGQP